MKKIPTLFQKNPNDLGRVIKSNPFTPYSWIRVQNQMEDIHIWVQHNSDELLVNLTLTQEGCYEELGEFLKDFLWEGLEMLSQF